MTIEEKVERLWERSLISDLLVAFATALDSKDWDAYAALYTDDGILVLPWTTIRKADMPGAVERDLSRYFATHHISANHSITISGDSATSRSYLLAMHVQEKGNQKTQWLVGGWYDNEYRKTERGWLISRVQITPIWESGVRP